MDTSEEYIKMCEKATEVQELWEYKEEDIPDTFSIIKYYGWCETCDSIRGQASWSPMGDGLISVLRFCHECGETLIVEPKDNYISYPEYGSIEDWSNGAKESVWLPRQDQLQEIIGGGHPGSMMELLVKICGWDGNAYNGDWLKFKSPEQLWLAFVMKKKYNKTWNGKEWVEIK